MKFQQKLEKISEKNNSLLCVGLDIDKGKIPNFLYQKKQNPYLDFNKSIIESTKDLVCAYKLNMAFYESFGKDGLNLLEQTIKFIPKETVVILDGKRNDISTSAQKYAESLFDYLKADAITINPYLGKDTIQPFLEYPDRCSFILCRTSNPSASDFQDLLIDGKPLYQIIAKKIKDWNKKQNCGLVAGATYPDELKIIREILGENVPFLIPGIGKQGGDVEKTVKYGTNSKGTAAIINSSRGIIYAGKNEDYAELSRKAAKVLKEQINQYR